MGYTHVRAINLRSCLTMAAVISRLCTTQPIPWSLLANPYDSKSHGFSLDVTLRWTVALCKASNALMSIGLHEQFWNICAGRTTSTSLQDPRVLVSHQNLELTIQQLEKIKSIPNRQKKFRVSWSGTLGQTVVLYSQQYLSFLANSGIPSRTKLNTTTLSCIRR
ncbi:hypothetical protein EV702DRAFT_204575 [Suillus placidus]|uniref:Uncharacterized protein n=1 Tax=Suillus placidus TaxID=48579 RepID=A0A9P6ZY62_9AGAM|nr:hypothetical protein EV702DRAFT_204575 [Suillus placidus]